MQLEHLDLPCLPTTLAMNFQTYDQVACKCFQNTQPTFSEGW